MEAAAACNIMYEEVCRCVVASREHRVTNDWTNLCRIYRRQIRDLILLDLIFLPNLSSGRI
jgi:hypothetical protein